MFCNEFKSGFIKVCVFVMNLKVSLLWYLIFMNLRVSLFKYMFCNEFKKLNEFKSEFSPAQKLSSFCLVNHRDSE